MARCPVTGQPVDRCDCGACEPDDDTAEPWRTVTFQPPSEEAP